MTLSTAASEVLVLSVRPRFAEAIVDGLKTIEVRRQKPNVQPGTLGLVYSSSPVQAVVGFFRVDRIFSGAPEELWVAAQHGAYISRQDFDSYFEGVEQGHGIAVSCAQRLPNPIGLSDLRVIWPGCKPPRSFGYLVAADAYSRKIMSNFRSRLFSDKDTLEESKRNEIDTNSIQDRKGSFLLRWDQVRALVSLLRAEDHQLVDGYV